MKQPRLRRAAAALSSLVSTGVLAALLGPAACSPDVSFGGVECDDGLTECGGVCADLTTDAAHCGVCGSACAPGATCTASQCGVFCDDPTVDCGGACVEIDSDPQHCGGCFLVCPAGTTCQAGSCEASGCAGALAECAGQCVDLGTDPENCGACGSVCPGTPCIAGVCDGSACPPGLIPCGGACVDVAADEQHCGGCGLACAPGESCLGGQCEAGCGPGETSCSGACVDLETDSDHCGSCNASCQGGELCAGGGCVSCPAGLCGLCEVIPIGSTVPQTVTGSTAGAPDLFTPTCTPPGAGERAYAFTAPAAGTYIFDTATSAYDTVLALLDSSCGSVACNDDTMGSQSRIETVLDANDTVIVVVDGFAGIEGNFVLHVQAESM